MHNLRDLSFDAAFIPSGCDQPGLPAITFGTGVLTGTLNAFAHVHNVTMPGDADSSVALGGGYLLGGGHSAFSNAFGLAVDRVLQFKVVTPDGVHRTVNACSHPDLFFFCLARGPARVLRGPECDDEGAPKVRDLREDTLNVDAAFSEIVREIRRYNKNQQTGRPGMHADSSGMYHRGADAGLPDDEAAGCYRVAWCCNDDSNTNALSTLVCSGMPGYGENIGSWPVLHIGY